MKISQRNQRVEQQLTVFAKILFQALVAATIQEVDESVQQLIPTHPIDLVWNDVFGIPETLDCMIGEGRPLPSLPHNDSFAQTMDEVLPFVTVSPQLREDPSSDPSSSQTLENAVATALEQDGLTIFRNKNVNTFPVRRRRPLEIAGDVDLQRRHYFLDGGDDAETLGRANLHIG